MEGLRECPRGLLRTIAYTQLCEAIEKDFGIELPRKAGKEIPKVIDELINIRATDPLLEKMAEALDEMLTFERQLDWDSMRVRHSHIYKADQALQEYREREDANRMHINE